MNAKAVSGWAATLVSMLFCTTALVQAYVIPTASMDPALQPGDRVLVDKLAYAPRGPVAGRLLPYSEIRRGDLVVFRYPRDVSQTYVKRCVGLPGDRVRIAAGTLYVNGAAVPEPYARHRLGLRGDFPPGGGELLVPPEHYFVLGDNRDVSSDSRAWGFVPRSHVIGRPVLVFWSFDWESKRVRWERAFTPVQ